MTKYYKAYGMKDGVSWDDAFCVYAKTPKTTKFRSILNYLKESIEVILNVTACSIGIVILITLWPFRFKE